MKWELKSPRFAEAQTNLGISKDDLTLKMKSEYDIPGMDKALC